jgi:integrase/recombinase XerC
MNRQPNEANPVIPEPAGPSVLAAIDQYLDSIRMARSERTAMTYKHAMNAFVRAIQEQKLEPEKIAVVNFTEDGIVWLATYLKNMSPATEALYLTSAAGFYEFLAAEKLAVINLARMRLLIRQRSRRQGQRLPQFPRDAMDQILDQCGRLGEKPSEDDAEKLRNLRDRAFLITLADTGLRVHEACGLRRGDLDWNEGKAVVIGKGNREAVIRFSSRSLTALRQYLSARAKLDGSSGKPLASLALFARHDKGAGQKIKAITTTTGRNIVAERVEEFLGKEAVGTITPHSFRHYFVTKVLRASGNLKLAQELARHKNIAVTERYSHLSNDELDKGFHDAIDEV